MGTVRHHQDRGKDPFALVGIHLPHLTRGRTFKGGQDAFRKHYNLRTAFPAQRDVNTKPVASLTHHFWRTVCPHFDASKLDEDTTGAPGLS